jgi:hypothetical protein
MSVGWVSLHISGNQEKAMAGSKDQVKLVATAKDFD